MNIFGQSASFWIAVGFATVFKLSTSERLSWKQGLITVSAALVTAWIATDPILDFMNWDPDTYKALTAAVIALVGENFMRFLVKLDGEALLKIWRGFRS